MARAGALGAAVLTALALPGLANADGDPASDYLIAQQTFYSGDEIPAERAQMLSAIVKNANTAGFEIRVALIATSADLGSVTSLMGKPQRYAQFLGQELSYAYRGRLLIVMPNGFGYSIRGRPAPNAKRALAALAPPGVYGARIADAATNAVHLLAQAGGFDVPLPKSRSGGATTGDRIKIAAIAVGAVAIAAAVALVRRGQRAARA